MTTELTDSTTTARTAELVAHLAGCDLEAATAAVERVEGSGGNADPLAVAARAVVDLSSVGFAAPAHRTLRMAGYVRAGADRVIDLRDTEPTPARGELRIARYLRQPAPTRLVEHLSLRRWERTTTPVT